MYRMKKTFPSAFIVWIVRFKSIELTNIAPPFIMMLLSLMLRVLSDLLILMQALSSRAPRSLREFSAKSSTSSFVFMLVLKDLLNSLIADP
jgi:hypothetical protein